jgi:hypothetical protein
LVVVQGHVAHQRLLQILGAVKAMCLEDICDAAVEALNHPIGSGCPGPGQAMLDTQLLAQQVQLMVATGLFLPAGEQAISELFTVLGQQPGYLDRTDFVHALKNALAPRTPKFGHSRSRRKSAAHVPAMSLEDFSKIEPLDFIKKKWSPDSTHIQA